MTDRTQPTALVLRALGLGDLLVAVPALRLLRRALPEHRIVLATPGGLAPLVALIDAVDVHHPLDDPAALDGPIAPDLAVNLHGRGPASHAALDALGPRRRVGHAAPGWDGPVWTEDPERSERRRWCDLLAACGLATPAEAAARAADVRLPPPSPPTGTVGHPGAPTVVYPGAPTVVYPGAPTVVRHGAPTVVHPGAPTIVHPGAAYGAKRWPVERFAAVARALGADGHRVVVTGSAGERGLTAAVPGEDRGGRTDLAALTELVAAARLVVSGDTGIAHLAVALGTPSVTLFGPVGPAQWGPPPGGPHTVLTDPALRRGARFVEETDPALLAVTVADVIGAASRLCIRY